MEAILELVGHVNGVMEVDIDRPRRVENVNLGEERKEKKRSRRTSPGRWRREGSRGGRGSNRGRGPIPPRQLCSEVNPIETLKREEISSD